jgi:hypothetical protein
VTAAGRLVAVPASLAGLAARQAGVVTRRQLAAAGIGKEQIRAAVAARRWQLVGRYVVVLHNAELTELQRQWVAVLVPEQLVALAGLTAAAVAGLRGFDDPSVHIVVAGSCGARLPQWVRVHNSRRFTAADIRPGPHLPRTTTDRALVDAAAWSASPRRACAILCAGVQQRLTRGHSLAAELERAGAVRHCRILRAVLGDIGGGGHTLSELDLAPLARRAGLPPPRRQVLRREAGGRVRYVDAEFDLPDGTSLMVEVDGAVHLKPVQWWNDLSRQNELVIGGGQILRFDSVTMRLNPRAVIDQLARMRRAHGG